MTPSTTHLSLFKALVSAWDRYKNKALFFLFVSTVVFLTMLALAQLLEGVLPLEVRFPWSVEYVEISLFTPAGILLYIIEEVYTYQLLKYSIALHTGKSPTGRSFFSVSDTYQLVKSSIAIRTRKKRAWRSLFNLIDRRFMFFFLARMRYLALFSLGLFLLILPGVLYLLTNFFAGYSIVFSLTTSLKNDATISFILTRNNRLRLLLFMLLTLIFHWPLALWSIFILPLETLMMLEMYKQLIHIKKEEIKTFTSLSPKP